MSLNEVAATDRFDNTEFSTEIIDGQALSMYTRYTCPECNEIIRFSKQNFEERAATRVTNLPPELARRIDEWAAARALGGVRFLDWLCPTCGLPVRVYAKPWAGGRGDHGIELLTVVECRRHDSNAP